MRESDFISESKIAELNQKKKVKITSENLYLIGNTVAYSSKQLFISAPRNCYTKSIGKFPKIKCFRPGWLLKKN